MIKGLNHLTLAVTDIEKSFRFYRDILGLTPHYKSKDTVYFQEGTLWLALSLDPNFNGAKENQGYTHYAFDVDQHHFKALSENIKNAGVTLFKENSSEGESLYFLDPDGHQLEIHVGNIYNRLAEYKAKQNGKRGDQFYNMDSLTLKGDRVSLGLSHLDEAARLLNFHEVNKHHFDPWDPLKPDDFYSIEYWKKRIFQDHLEYQRGQSVRLVMRLKDEDSIIGMINFTNFERGPFQNCRLGYKIAASFEGKGLMKEGLSLGIDHIFKERNFHRIEANYIPRNVKSGNLLKALGFQEHGLAKSYLKIAGVWEDHILTSLTNS